MSDNPVQCKQLGKSQLSIFPSLSSIIPDKLTFPYCLVPCRIVGLLQEKSWLLVANPLCSTLAFLPPSKLKYTISLEIIIWWKRRVPRWEDMIIDLIPSLFPKKTIAEIAPLLSLHCIITTLHQRYSQKKDHQCVEKFEFYRGRGIGESLAL